MAKKKEERPEEHEGEDYVPVVYARDEDQAEGYKELLADHEIPAVIDVEAGRGRRGIPVLVSDDLLDEASQVIADFEQNEEFEQDEDIEEEEEDEEDDLQPLDEEFDDADDEEEEEDEEEDEDEDEDEGFDDEDER